MSRAEVERLADVAEPIEVERPGPAIEPFRPFPVDALPDPISKYAAHVADGMDVDAIFIILPALSAFTGAIGNAVRVVVTSGWVEPCCLWTGLLALPGSLKTQTQARQRSPCTTRNGALMPSTPRLCASMKPSARNGTRQCERRYKRFPHNRMSRCADSGLLATQRPKRSRTS